MKRFVRCGLILAFLLASMHVVVDHGAGGQHPFALLPHPCPSSLHEDDHHPLTHDHDEDGEPSHDHDPTHHQAETHSHCTWYTSTKSLLHLAPIVCSGSLFGMSPAVLDTLSLHENAPTPPPRSIPLYLRCSVLLI